MDNLIGSAKVYAGYIYQTVFPRAILEAIYAPDEVWGRDQKRKWSENWKWKWLKWIPCVVGSETKNGPSRNLVMYRHSYEKKLRVYRTFIFNSVFTKFKITEILHTSLHQRVCRTSRTIKHGISTICIE